MPIRGRAGKAPTADAVPGRLPILHGERMGEGYRRGRQSLSLCNLVPEDALKMLKIIGG